MTSNDNNAANQPATTAADSAETTAGRAHDETTVVPPVTVAAQELAWSADTEVIEQPWVPVLGQAAVMVAIGAAVAVVIGILGWVAFHPDSPAVSVPSTMPAAALPPISAPAPTSDPEVVQPTTSSFSGRYTMTVTNPDNGRSVTQAWVVTPCGDGCANIATEDDAPYAQAHLAGGFWSWDDITSQACDDGSRIDNAGTSHNVLDATTLRGTSYITWSKACAGSTTDPNTDTIVLTRAAVAAPSPPPPTTGTVTPKAAAAPPAPSRDDEFIERLQADQLVLHNRTEALSGAHWVCRQLAAGHSQADIVASAERDNPTVTHLGMVDYVSTAAAFYCPEYAGN
jgi:hypothetical protein